jgi:hypothetical protein
MGLADEQQTGVWRLDPQLEAKLRGMGERGDIMVTMHQVMRAHGIDRLAGDFALFGGAAKSTPVIGKLVEVGIADEMTDRKYLVVDGIDGRIHYAETGKLSGHDIPEPGMIVALSGGAARGRLREPRVEVVSYWPIETLTTAEAPTWLDRTILAEARPVIRATGFGAEVSKALVAREDWLIAKGHAIAEQPGTITPKPDLLQALHQRSLALAWQRLEQQLDVPHLPAFVGMHITGRHIGTVDLPLQRLAVIKEARSFTLVPWRPELLQMRGRDIAVGINDRAMTLSIAPGRGRDLGLSR